MVEITYPKLFDESAEITKQSRARTHEATKFIKTISVVCFSTNHMFIHVTDTSLLQKYSVITMLLHTSSESCLLI